MNEWKYLQIRKLWIKLSSYISFASRHCIWQPSTTTDASFKYNISVQVLNILSFIFVFTTSLLAILPFLHIPNNSAKKIWKILPVYITSQLCSDVFSTGHIYVLGFSVLAAPISALLLHKICSILLCFAIIIIILKL